MRGEQAGRHFRRGKGVSCIMASGGVLAPPGSGESVSRAGVQGVWAPGK